MSAVANPAAGLYEGWTDCVHNDDEEGNPEEQLKKRLSSSQKCAKRGGKFGDKVNQREAGMTAHARK